MYVFGIRNQVTREMHTYRQVLRMSTRIYANSGAISQGMRLVQALFPPLWFPLLFFFSPVTPVPQLVPPFSYKLVTTSTCYVLSTYPMKCLTRLSGPHPTPLSTFVEACAAVSHDLFEYLSLQTTYSLDFPYTRTPLKFRPW